MPKGVYIRTKEGCLNMSKAHIGYNFSKEHRENLSKAGIKRKHSKKIREKISKLLIGNKNAIGNKSHLIHGQTLTLSGKMWLRCKNRVKCHNFYINKNIKCFLTWQDVRKLWIRDGADFMIKPCIHRINDDGNYIFENCEIMENSEHRKLHWAIKRRRK